MKSYRLPESDNESAEYGLRYANNEVCYPATLVVGDLIKALDSGRYDLDETAVIITQTGGQCRATNYVALLKRAMVEAGYAQVPVISLGMGSSVNPQPGFGLNWAKFLPLALAAVLLGDCISKFYHSAAVREIRPGEAMRLREAYLEKAKEAISRNAVGEALRPRRRGRPQFRRHHRGENAPEGGHRRGDISEIQLIRPQTGSPLARRTRRGGRSARPDGFLHGGICKP